jgi:hypothetical protein
MHLHELQDYSIGARMGVFMPKMHFIQIALTPLTRRRLKQLCRSSGIKQSFLLTQTIEWLIDQPPLIQRAVVAHYPNDVKSAILKPTLDRMLEDSDSSPGKTID